MSTTTTAFADDKDVRKGAIVRIPAAGKSRPYCLKIVSREPVSQVTGAIPVVGEVLGVNGTTTRARRLIRSAVLVPGRYEFFRKVPSFTVKLATLRLEGGGPMQLINRWGVVNDETGEPLPAGGTGPAVVEVPCADGSVHRYVQVGDWEGKPTPWLARDYMEQTLEERSMRRDDLAQCLLKATSARGIIRIGRLTYDCSTWPHSPTQELVEISPGITAWRDTYVCKHCGRDLTWIKHSPWFRAADGTTECSAEVYVP